MCGRAYGYADELNFGLLILSKRVCVLVCESQKACGAILRVSDVHSVVGLSVSAAYCHLGQLHTVRHRQLVKQANYYTPHPLIFICQPVFHILSFLFFISPSREKGVSQFTHQLKVSTCSSLKMLSTDLELAMRTESF